MVVTLRGCGSPLNAVPAAPVAQKKDAAGAAVAGDSHVGAGAPLTLLGGCDGGVAPRLVARQNVQLGLGYDGSDAVLGELRRQDEFDLGNRPGGSEDTSSRRGLRAEEPLRRHHGRTRINRAFATLADDHSRDCQMTREGPAKR